MKFHPRRNWLLRHHGGEVALRLQSLGPTPYDADSLFADVRFSKDEPHGSKHASSSRPSSAQTDATLEGVAYSETRKSTERREWDTSTAAFEAAALYGADVWEKLDSIDSHVYQAMSNLSGQNIDNLADLNATLGHYHHDVWGELSKGAVNKVKGHLAETYAADHLAGAGYQVEWPQHSNQQGWDLLVNGHEVNVKLVADSASLHQHFAQYPDVPVVVPVDAHISSAHAAIYQFDPAGGLDHGLEQFLDHAGGHAVIVDHALSGAAVKEQAIHASDYAVGGASAVEAHVPWITVATASWRELKLLNDGKTDLLSAGKNLSSDVIGRGGGAALGAKAGAAIGTFIAPGIGTAVGAVVGGISGSLTGNRASKAFKHRSLDAAVSRAQEAQAALEAEKQATESACAAEYGQAKQAQQDELRAASEKYKAQIALKVERLQASRREAANLSLEEATDILKRCAAERERVQETWLRQRRALGFFKYHIWPNIAASALFLQRQSLQEATRQLQRLQKDSSTGTMSSFIEFSRRLGKIGLGKDLLLARFSALDRNRQTDEERLRQDISQSYEQMVGLRKRAFDSLLQLSNTLAERMRQRLGGLGEKLEQCVDEVRKERGKLGLT